MAAKAKTMNKALHIRCNVLRLLVAVVASSATRIIEEIVVTLRAGCIGMICMLKINRQQRLQGSMTRPIVFDSQQQCKRESATGRDKRPGWAPAHATLRQKGQQATNQRGRDSSAISNQVRMRNTVAVSACRAWRGLFLATAIDTRHDQGNQQGETQLPWAVEVTSSVHEMHNGEYERGHSEHGLMVSDQVIVAPPAPACKRPGVQQISTP
jgi:hypothetical protein